MHCSVAAVLATFLAGQAAAASIRHGHQHLHTKKEAKASAMEVGGPVKRDGISEIASDLSSSIASNPPTTSIASKLTALGALPGLNAESAGSTAWIGSGGDYTNNFTNNAGEDLILIIWGPTGSWVNVGAPLITIPLASGESQLISFATGLSGAWSTFYSDTELVNGQVSNTWGEFTFSPSGVVDVSREANMNGHGMSIVGPTCTADMDKCVFVCSSGDVCMTDYLLQNCDNGSQEGATYGEFYGSPSGGCGWNLAPTAALQTQFY